MTRRAAIALGTLAAAAQVASAAAPAREGLGPGEPITELIRSHPCHAVLLGDSISSRNTNSDRQSSLFWGIARTWQPDEFVGLAAPTNNNFPLVQTIAPAPAIAESIVRTLTSDGPMRTFFGGHERVAGAPALDVRWLADAPDGSPIVASRLELGAPWAAGDWFLGRPLDASFLVVSTPSTHPALRAESRSGTGAFAGSAIVDVSGERSIARIDAPRITADASPQFRLVAAGGRDESLAPDTLIWLTTHLRRADAQGFFLDSLAVGGSGAADWQSDGPFADDALLAQYFEASGLPDLFIIMLGANDGQFAPAWQADIAALVDRLDAASQGHARFLLIATYGTVFSLEHADALVAGELLYDLAAHGTSAVAGARIAMVNLPALLAGPLNQPILFDPIHPSPGGADRIAAWLWQAITLPRACRADLAGPTAPGTPDGLLTGADFLAFLDAFAQQAPEADLSSPGVAGKPDKQHTGADFLWYLDLFSQGCD